ncbi:hypothetical protein ACJX0J_010848, partial [Zea mays]
MLFGLVIAADLRGISLDAAVRFCLFRFGLLLNRKGFQKRHISWRIPHVCLENPYILLFMNIGVVLAAVVDFKVNLVQTKALCLLANLFLCLNIHNL